MCTFLTLSFKIVDLCTCTLQLVGQASMFSTFFSIVDVGIRPCSCSVSIKAWQVVLGAKNGLNKIALGTAKVCLTSSRLSPSKQFWSSPSKFSCVKVGFYWDFVICSGKLGPWFGWIAGHFACIGPTSQFCESSPWELIGLSILIRKSHWSLSFPFLHSESKTLSSLNCPKALRI